MTVVLVLVSNLGRIGGCASGVVVGVGVGVGVGGGVGGVGGGDGCVGVDSSCLAFALFTG